LYSVERCILAYLGLEIMEPFVAYAAPRVDAAAHTAYLRRWETRLLEIVGDTAWHAQLQARAEEAARNRDDVEEKAWSSQR
jgi:NAD(P)H dehydrogenase (quinone)